MVINVPTVKLNDGQEIPVFGLGTWKVSFHVKINVLNYLIVSQFSPNLVKSLKL